MSDKNKEEKKANSTIAEYRKQREGKTFQAHEQK